MGCTASCCVNESGFVIKRASKSGVETPATTIVDDYVHEVSGQNHEAYSARVHVCRSITEDYEIEKSKVVGSGYSGPVRLGKCRLTGKLVAVKSFNKHMLNSKRLKFLQGEVSIYLLLDHPNVARLLDVYEDTNCVNIVMEYCSGKELYYRLIKRSSYSEKDAANATYDMLLAVNYLHQHNVVHRDIKLENFLYEDPSDNSRLKLIDFGFSKLWYPDSENSRLKASCGSIQYVAPEVLSGRYTAQCDMWSLGVVVFMLLSGEPPFEGSEEDIIQNIQLGNYSMKSKRWEHVSPCGIDFVKKLLVLDPDRRMTSSEALNHPWMSLVAREHSNKSVPAEVLLDIQAFATSSHLRRAALSMLAYRLTSDEIHDLHENFLSMDTDKQGTISFSEFLNVMCPKLNLSPGECRSMFEKLDRSNKGEIEYTTFLAATLASRMRLHENIIRHVFDQLDADHDGLISLNDLRAVLGPTIDGGDDISVILEESLVDKKNGLIDFDRFEKCFNMTEPIVGFGDEHQSDDNCLAPDASPPPPPLDRQKSIKSAAMKIKAVHALVRAVTTPVADIAIRSPPDKTATTPIYSSTTSSSRTGGGDRDSSSNHKL